MGKGFTANKVALNLDATNKIKFILNNSPEYTLRNDYIKNTHNCH